MTLIGLSDNHTGYLCCDRRALIATQLTFTEKQHKLEKSILPLHTSTQILTKRENKIDEAASNQEGIAAEEELILRGCVFSCIEHPNELTFFAQSPQPDQLDAYTDALERLNASIAFGSAEENQRDTARLVETGAKKLAQLFTKLVASGSTGSHPAGSDFQYFPFPRDELAMLLPSSKSFALSLHPLHTAILSSLKEAQRGYAEMRGSWARKCLEVYGRRVIDRAETTDRVASGRELAKWMSDLLSVIEMASTLLACGATSASTPVFDRCSLTRMQRVADLREVMLLLGKAQLGKHDYVRARRASQFDPVARGPNTLLQFESLQTTLAKRRWLWPFSRRERYGGTMVTYDDV
ncbi:hypothetical protein V8E53_005936 [Lactarius tabidus]